MQGSIPNEECASQSVAAVVVAQYPAALQDRLSGVLLLAFCFGVTHVTGVGKSV